MSLNLTPRHILPLTKSLPAPLQTQKRHTFTNLRHNALRIGQTHQHTYSTLNSPSYSSAQYKRTTAPGHFNSIPQTTPDYILPYANQTRLNVYLVSGLALGLLLGFVTKPYVETALSALFGSEEANAPENSADFHTRLDAIFDKYVDSQTQSGEPALSPIAFIKALIGPGMALPAWAALPRDEKTNELIVNKKLKNSRFMQMVNLADVDRDELITRTEFKFFHTLVSYTPRQFEIAFKLFDKDDSGSVQFEEFAQIMGGANANSRVNLAENGLMSRFFGPRLDKSLSFDDFHAFLREMKRDLLDLEFSQHDFENDRTISVESFTELMSSSANFNSMRAPFFKNQLNLLKTKGFFKPSGKIDFDTFVTFAQIAEQLEDIESAINILDVTGHKIDRASFTAAIQKVGHISAPKRAVELIFAIFDTNGDGELDHREFVRAMRARKSAEDMKNIEAEGEAKEREKD